MEDTPTAVRERIQSQRLAFDRFKSAYGPLALKISRQLREALDAPLSPSTLANISIENLLVVVPLATKLYVVLDSITSRFGSSEALLCSAEVQLEYYEAEAKQSLSDSQSMKDLMTSIKAEMDQVQEQLDAMTSEKDLAEDLSMDLFRSAELTSREGYLALEWYERCLLQSIEDETKQSL